MEAEGSEVGAGLLHEIIHASSGDQPDAGLPAAMGSAREGCNGGGESEEAQLLSLSFLIEEQLRQVPLLRLSVLVPTTGGLVEGDLVV